MTPVRMIVGVVRRSRGGPSRPVGQGLGGGDPAAAAGDDQAQLRLAVAELGQQRLDVGLEGLAVDIELDRRGGSLQPVEVLGECVGPARV